MATPLKEWVRDVWIPFQKLPPVEQAHARFFRDPPRAQQIDRSFFFSPADGIILYQKVVAKDDGAIIEVKGRNFTLHDLLQKDLEQPALVIGVFMTAADVHVNRVPMDGILRYERVEHIYTRNLPMLWVEEMLTEQQK